MHLICDVPAFADSPLLQAVCTFLRTSNSTGSTEGGKRQPLNVSQLREVIGPLMDIKAGARPHFPPYDWCSQCIASNGLCITQWGHYECQTS